MSALLALVAVSALAGPFKVDGADLSKDLVASGGAKVGAAGIALNGGRVALKPARQKALDAQIAGKPFAVVVSLKEVGTAAGTALSVGPLKLTRKADGWYVAAGDGTISLGKASAGALKAVVLSDGSMIRAFRDGKIAGVASFTAKGSAPLALGPWKGTILDLEILPRSLMPQEAMTLSQSSQVEGKAAVVEAELVQFTKVPEPKEVLPYKHALIVQEYRILSVTSGGMAGVKPGAKIRVKRWGIISGAKTGIATLTKGAKVTLNLERIEDHPEIEREFTVDKLPDDFDTPYLYDTTRPGA
jgi:hypothetical protein